MNYKLSNRENRHGFTLVEILVVVLIIGILAGLISAAAIRARNRGRVAVISTDIRQLSMALEQYKQQLGEYPPDFFEMNTDSGKALVLQHVSRAFPRLVLSGNTIGLKWQSLRDEIYITTNNAVDINTIILDPGTALRFWLGGMPDPASGRPMGFSKDPAHPFDNTLQSRIGPFYDFDPGRLPAQPAAELGRYYPPGINVGVGKPYVYFRAETVQGHQGEYCYINVNVYTLKTWSDPAGATIIDSAKPYWDDRNKCWVNDTSFQILCCGLDGRFSKENVYKSGRVAGAGVPTANPDFSTFVIGLDSAGYTSLVPPNFDHIDDQNNFSTGTIGDNLP